MARYDQILEKDGYSYFRFITDDITEANILRRAIMSEIETYAVGLVIFDSNISSRSDEILALRLGMCPIDQSALQLNDKGEMRTRVELTGPADFTTADIPDIPFAQNILISSLFEGDELKLDLIIRKGTAKEHIKHRPVATIGMSPVEGGYMFSYKNKGMMDDQTIIEAGMAKMYEAAHRQPITLFSVPVIPESLVQQGF